MTRRRGLTLLELLIAIALVIALFGALFTFLFDLLSARVRVIDEDARRLAAATLIEAVESDLATCVAGDPGHGAGVLGDGTTLSILSRGTAAALAERGPDDPAVFGDLQRGEYRFDAGELLARRGPAAEPIDEVPAEPLGGAVHKLRFRFHDGERWADSFDSLAAGGLPRAVEIAIWFDPWPGSAPLGGPMSAAETGGGEPAAGFDESDSSLQSEIDTAEPRPDRLRVIAVFDSAPDDSTSSEAGP